MWNDQLLEKPGTQLKQWEPEAEQEAGPAPRKKNQRLKVYWTDMDEWFSGTFRTSRVEDAGGGDKQRSSCVVYDAAGPWVRCNEQQLTYWHCLGDEQWQPLDTAGVLSSDCPTTPQTAPRYC